MSKKLKITVGFPSPELIHHHFSRDLLSLICHNAVDYEFNVTNAHGSRIVANRNTIVNEALKWGADYILWLDADTLFPASGLKRLLAHNKDVVCAAASRRTGNNRSPAAYPEDIKQYVPGDQLMKMEFIGMPFMLTKTSIFQKMEKPYFAEPPRRLIGVYRGKDSILGHIPVELLLDDVMPEDEYFCWKIRQAGFDIWCDMELTMEIGHVGTKVYYVESPVPSSEVPTGKIKFEIEKSEESEHRAKDGIGE